LTKLLLIRHGHVDGIKPERFRGRTDLPLISRGLLEAEAVARRVSADWRPGKVYTSPMKRCIDTGAAICKACGIEAEILEDLNDIDYGAWQWKTFDQIKQTEPKLFATWFETPELMRFPGGESLQDLVARSADALRFVLANHSADTIVFVTHDSVIRALLLQLLDQPLSAYWRFAQDPCCVNEIDVIDARVRVLRVNDTCHLRGISSS
jgi:phosphoserine phosphatase